MIKGIDGRPYIDIEPFLDMDGFSKLHPEICRGIAVAREYAKEGTWIVPGFDIKDMSYILNWKPVHTAFDQYQALPADHPLKVAGADIFPKNFKDYKQRNLFTRYLKSAFGANDPYLYYFLWEEGDWNERGEQKSRTEESQHFPNTVAWIENLITQNIFKSLGRVIIFVCEANGIQFEHRDLSSVNGKLKSGEYTPHRSEFIHLRYRTKRGFYLWDHSGQNKQFINSRAVFFNDQDWHGGEQSVEQVYSVRIDGKFTDEFRKKLGIDHLETY